MPKYILIFTTCLCFSILSFAENDNSTKDYLLTLELLENEDNSEFQKFHKSFKRDCSASKTVILKNFEDSNSKRFSFRCITDDLVDEYSYEQIDDEIMLYREYSFWIRENNKITLVKVEDKFVEPMILSGKYDVDSIPDDQGPDSSKPYSSSEKIFSTVATSSLKSIVSTAVFAFSLKHAGDKLNPERYKQEDKRGHLVAGYLVGNLASRLANEFYFKDDGNEKGNSSLKSFIIGSVSALSVGVLKELIDKHCHCGTVEKNDIRATLIGGILGAAAFKIEFKFD